MKILLVTGSFAPSTNGVAISTAFLAKKLVEANHKVLVIAPQNKKVGNDPRYVIRYPSIGNPFILDYPIPLFPLTPKIFEKIKKFKPDIVHVHHPYHIGLFAQLVSQTLKIPLVFTFHTRVDYYAETYFKFLPDKLKPKFVANNVFDFCKKCDLVIAPSRDAESYLNKHHIVNTSVIPMIVDDLGKKNTNKVELREKIGIPQDKKILLYVGRLSLEKNLKLLVDAFKKLNHEYILVICGVGPNEEVVKKQVKKLGISNRVLFMGNIDRKNLGQYYDASDYFVYPSVSETQGLILWEALSRGLPIVVADSKVAREWVNKDVGIVSKNRSQDFAQAILKISDNKYPLISKRALLWGRKFSSHKTIYKVVSTYKGVLKYHDSKN